MSIFLFSFFCTLRKAVCYKITAYGYFAVARLSLVAIVKGQRLVLKAHQFCNLKCLFARNVAYV